MKARDALRMDKPIVIRQLLRGIGKHVKAGLADFLDRCRPDDLRGLRATPQRLGMPPASGVQPPQVREHAGGKCQVGSASSRELST